MLIICTVHSPTGGVTHHLVRAQDGPSAYRRLKPLLAPEFRIDTMTLEWWRRTRGSLPRALVALEHPTASEKAVVRAGGGTIVQ